MIGDGEQRGDVDAGLLPPEAGDIGPVGQPVWVLYRGVTRAWPAYDPEAGRRDGVHDHDQRRRRGPWTGWIVAAMAATLLVGGVVTVRSASREPRAVESVPRVVVPDRTIPQWTPADASLTAGLVRVTVTASVEADGIVLSRDGLIATSYARLVDLAGTAHDITAVELRVVLDGGTPRRASIIGFDASVDVAVLRVPGFEPTSVARAGTAVHEGDALTLLDDQGEGLPILGYPIVAGSTNQHCSRSGAAQIGRPRGFQFALPVASAEPGGAVVRADGSVVGLYYGGDGDAHCAVPIATVAAVVRNVARGHQTATTRVGPPGGLGIRVTDIGGAYPTVTEIETPGELAEAAGVKLGDSITRVDGTSLWAADLTTMGPGGVIRSLEPGRTVSLEWLSGGVERRATVQVSTGAQPQG